MRSVVMAGGGSGGHLSPGLAIAERLAEGAPVHAIFACSERAIDERMLGPAGVERHPMPARPPSLRPTAWPAFAGGMRRTMARVRALLRDADVGLVVALGGFVSVPAVLAARRARVPVALLNLDAVPGRANRLVSRLADECWTAAPVSGGRLAHAPVVGLPLRRAALADASPESCRAQLGLDPARPVLLVTGASQGASSVNRLVLHLAEHHPELLAGWQILHLAGPGAADEVRAGYARLGLAADVREFLDRIGLAWGAAEAAISRAGANSVAEVAANRVPTLFLPYPWHKDRHQHRNAEPLRAAEAALVLEDRIDPDRTLVEGLDLVRGLLVDASLRTGMRARLASAAPPDAAATVADLIRTRLRA